MILTTDELDLPLPYATQDKRLRNSLEVKTIELLSLWDNDPFAKRLRDDEKVDVLDVEIEPIMRTKVAGTSHLENYDEVIGSLEPQSLLILRREPENAYDPSAIALYTIDDLKAGYIPAESNELLGHFLDAGIPVYAKVISVQDHGNWANVQIFLYLERDYGTD